MSILQSEALTAAGASEYGSNGAKAHPSSERFTVDESWDNWYWRQEAGFSFDLNVEADNREQVQRNFLHYRELSLMKLRQRNIVVVILSLIAIVLIVALAITITKTSGSVPPSMPPIKAVCVIKGDGGISGLITMVSVTGQKTKIVGSVSGLSPGSHGMHIHELGDLSAGCNATGTHYNPFGLTHGAPTDAVRHVGDMGNIVADANGVATINYEDDLIKSGDVLGRAIIVHLLVDDLGQGGFPDSKTTGHAGARIGCGVIGMAKAPASP